MLPDASRYLPLKILFTNSYFYFQIFAIMADEIVVESNPEAADGDDISSGQPLPESEQPAMAALASDSTSPASNMAANGRTQDGVPAGRGKSSLTGQKWGLAQCLWALTTKSSILTATGPVRDIRYPCPLIHMLQWLLVLLGLPPHRLI